MNMPRRDRCSPDPSTVSSPAQSSGPSGLGRALRPVIMPLRIRYEMDFERARESWTFQPVLRWLAISPSQSTTSPIRPPGGRARLCQSRPPAGSEPWHSVIFMRMCSRGETGGGDHRIGAVGGRGPQFLDGPRLFRASRLRAGFSDWSPRPG